MNKTLYLLILLFSTLSCSSNLVFEQANDLQLKPVVVANLVSFDIYANQFVVGGIEQTMIENVIDFTLFNNSDFIDNLKSIELFFEFNNTINRAYSVNLSLLDSNDVNLYTIPIDVPAYKGNANVITKTEIFEDDKLYLLKNTRKMAFVIVMLPGVPLTNSSVGNLKLRSSGTVYFEPQ
jgi:hypothetical protein